MNIGTDQLKEVLAELFGFNLESQTGIIVEGVVEYGAMLTPYIGSAMNFIKFRRIETRLQKHSEELAELRNLLITLDSNFQQFIRDKVFPLVIDNIYEETQEEKIGVILNGLAGVIKNRVADEDLIITYFDVLNQLRIAEIQHLFSNYDNRNRAKIDMSFLNLAMDRTREGRKKYAELQGFKNYVDNKLLRLGLLRYKQGNDNTYSYEYMIPSYKPKTEDNDDRKWILDQYFLSDFGKQFIAFFESNK
ncbi:hypothetical protein [Brevibacillus sp. MER 51]|uniref:hypothetical protein n=1 Tax=Brevibacillus sp. MER 51 TaxID=2939560 RepID=UPI00203B6AAC|nr:hypothetical protein [Brevibacillus sp. MER 51]MCM3141316.1 hypothetical protein [Brevibacillus sp. MER 51]